MKAPRDPKHHKIGNKNKQTPHRHKKTQEETPYIFYSIVFIQKKIGMFEKSELKIHLSDGPNCHY